MSDSDLPTTTAEAMEQVADWFDVTDAAMALMPYVRDNPSYARMVEGKAVQAGLRSTAEWMRAHPDVDADIFEAAIALTLP